jgi:hypothetical protein
LFVGDLGMSQDGSGCKDCKHVREHVSSVLPFKVLEAVAEKPLRIGGVALAAGMSRNFNVYTPEELRAFADKLVDAPVYIEHVAVDSAAGKVTKCIYDPTARCLNYEAEIYDTATADKIRRGLIQHVSVGADYNTLDVVDAKVPHGLYNPELSLVAVPGVPETNVQVLEHLALGKNPVQLAEKDLNAIAEKVAAKVSGQNTETIESLKLQISEANTKLTDAESKCKTAENASDEAKDQLVTANKTIEELRKQLPAGGLLKNPSVMIPLSEHIACLESLLPSQMVQRSSLGMQRICQSIRSEVFKAKERLGSGP